MLKLWYTEKFPNPIKIGKSSKTLDDYKISTSPSNKTGRKKCCIVIL